VRKGVRRISNLFGSVLQLMATKKSAPDDTLTRVARTVGSALGTVASKVNGLVGDSSEKPSEKPSPKPKTAAAGKAASASTTKPRVRRAPASVKAKAPQDKIKTKRARHRRKLGRKTAG
jgi:hypothetical protein